MVMLAATVRAARELQRRERVDGLKERIFDGGYAVNAKSASRNTICGSRDNVSGAQNSFMESLHQADRRCTC